MSHTVTQGSVPSATVISVRQHGETLFTADTVLVDVRCPRCRRTHTVGLVDRVEGDAWCPISGRRYHVLLTDDDRSG